MSPDTYICVDWGTSHLRATLCEYAEGHSTVGDTTQGPGIKDARESIERTLFRSIQAWTAKVGRVPVLLAGMVGSNIGWRATPYLECPILVAEIARQCFRFVARGHEISIVPGLECVNGLGEFDLMRGEELQILGWLSGESTRESGEHLVCLPGTHTKWARVRDGKVESFQTATTGELFALLKQHSVLLATDEKPAANQSFDQASFTQGVEAARKANGNVSHSLFGVRGRLLKTHVSRDESESYLSGVLVGADVLGALDAFAESGHEVSIIGAPELCDRFSIALELFGRDSRSTDSAAASLQGFNAVYQSLYSNKNIHRVSA